MKKNILLLNLLVCLLFVAISCSKSDAVHNNPLPQNIIDSGCGCNTDSVKGYATYSKFYGNNYKGYLSYISYANVPGWYLNINITDSPWSWWGGVGKVCNPNLASIKAITDTSSRLYSIPIKVAGTTKKLSSSEAPSFGLSDFQQTFYFDIVVDSMQKR